MRWRCPETAWPASSAARASARAASLCSCGYAAGLLRAPEFLSRGGGFLVAATGWCLEATPRHAAPAGRPRGFGTKTCPAKAGNDCEAKDPQIAATAHFSADDFAADRGSTCAAAPRRAHAVLRPCASRLALVAPSTTSGALRRPQSGATRTSEQRPGHCTPAAVNHHCLGPSATLPGGFIPSEPAESSSSRSHSSSADVRPRHRTRWHITVPAAWRRAGGDRRSPCRIDA